MREFLVTKFVCAKCGANLKLADDTPKNAGQYAGGEPTGATMVQQLMAIEPCECVTQQLDSIRRAAKVLFGSLQP
jgi:hypothetical protein